MFAEKATIPDAAPSGMRLGFRSLIVAVSMGSCAPRCDRLHLACNSSLLRFRAVSLMVFLTVLVSISKRPLVRKIYSLSQCRCVQPSYSSKRDFLKMQPLRCVSQRRKSASGRADYACPGRGVNLWVKLSSDSILMHIFLADILWWFRKVQQDVTDAQKLVWQCQKGRLLK